MSAERRARRHLPRETGGLLLGYRDGLDVHIVDAIEVGDASAGRSHYVLRHAARERALAEYLNALPPGSPVGYVGTWHSHPANVGPSWTDRQTFRHDVLRAPDTVAMVVLGRAGVGWEPHAFLPHGRCWIRKASAEVA